MHISHTQTHTYICTFPPPLFLFAHIAQRYTDRNHTGELRSCFWGSSAPPIIPSTCAGYFHTISPICPPLRPLQLRLQLEAITSFPSIPPFIPSSPTSGQECLVSFKEVINIALMKRGRHFMCFNMFTVMFTCVSGFACRLESL